MCERLTGPVVSPPASAAASCVTAVCLIGHSKCFIYSCTTPCCETDFDTFFRADSFVSAARVVYLPLGLKKVWRKRSRRKSPGYSSRCPDVSVKSYCSSVEAQPSVDSPVSASGHH